MWTAKTEIESAPACVIMWSPFINNIIYRMLCFVKTILRKLMSYMHISHTNAHALHQHGRLILNVERFWNGPVHKFYSLKASYMCKVHTSCPTASDRYQARVKAPQASSQLSTVYVCCMYTALKI